MDIKAMEQDLTLENVKEKMDMDFAESNNEKDMD